MSEHDFDSHEDDGPCCVPIMGGTVKPGAMQGWSRRDGTRVPSFESAVSEGEATALIYYVDPESWVPIALQKVVLWFRRHVLRQDLEE